MVSTKRGTLIFTLLASPLSLCLFSCSDASFQSAQTQFERFHQAIDNEDYEQAQALLDQAAPLANSENDRQIIAYNKAIIQILRGECKDAVMDMKDLLQAEKQQHMTTYSAQPLLYGQMPHETHMAIHNAIALGLLCPMPPYPGPTQDELREAVYHLTHVIQNGSDMRELLNVVYTKLFPPCPNFADPNEPQNDTPQTAFDIAGLHGIVKELTLCPGPGRWFQFEAKKHESLSILLKMRPLARHFWIDDSSRLPFTRLHVDLYKAPLDGQIPESPLGSFIQPLPEDLPTTSDYSSQQISTPSYIVQTSGKYYVHIYTEDNGEAKLLPKFSHKIDCRYLDDLETYTEDFQQIPVELLPNKAKFEHTICPGRPDLYKIKLAPKQSVILSLRSTSPELIGKRVQLSITDDFHHTYEWIQTTDAEPHENIPHFKSFKATLKNSNAFDEFYYNNHVLVQNPENAANTLYVAVSADGVLDGIQHDIAMALSTPCDKNAPAQNKELPLQLTPFNQDNVIFLPPQWLCPGETLIYRASPPPNNTNFNAQIFTNVISDYPFDEKHLMQASYIRMPPDNKDYIAENSTVQRSEFWDAPHAILDYNLHTPLLSNSSIKLQMNAQRGGFTLTTIIPPKLSDQEKNEQKKDEKQEKREQDPDKKEKNPSKEENTPTPDPEKPSESPATPQGQGSDTTGNESTPNPDDPSEGNAHQFDPSQVERAYIDTLLDAIEHGQLETPIQGNIHEKRPQKDW